MKTLSICIPTYNRANHLEHTLEQISSEIDGIEDEVEVCVSDNASPDNTADILDKMSKKLPLVWQRNKENLGFDFNLLAVSGLAHGGYVWFLGDDDKIIPGTIGKLVNDLKICKTSSLAPNAIYLNHKKSDSKWWERLPFEDFRIIEKDDISLSLFSIACISSVCINKKILDAVIREKHEMIKSNKTFDEVPRGYLHSFFFLECLKSSPMIGIEPSYGISYKGYGLSGTTKKLMLMSLLNLFYYYKINKYYPWWKHKRWEYRFISLVASGTRALIHPELENLYETTYLLLLHVRKQEAKPLEIVLIKTYRFIRKIGLAQFLMVKMYKAIKRGTDSIVKNEPDLDKEIQDLINSVISEIGRP